MTRKFLLLLLLSFGLIVFRFWNLTTLPNGFYWDEQDTVYQAQSLLKTGRDYFGNPFPLFPHSFADYRTPLNIYFTVITVKIFGMSVMAARIVPEIMGFMSLIGIYFLSRLYFKTGSVIPVLIVGFSPWHMLFSRYNGEILSMFFFIVFALLFYFRSFRKPGFLVYSGLFFGLSLASYSTAKLLTPLIVIFLLIFFRPEKISSFLKIFLSFLIIVFTFGVVGSGGSRFHDISVFTDPQISSQVDRDRLYRAVSSGSPYQVGMTPSASDRIFVNKMTLLIQRITNNYLANFSTEFLFSRGDINLRHSVGADTIGQLLWIDAPLILFGLISLKSNRKSFLIVFLLLVSPLASAVTRDGAGHAGRSFLMLLPLCLLAVLGYQKLANFKILIISLYLLNILYFSQYFFSFYRSESASAFDWGYTEVIKKAVEVSPSYDSVYIDFYHDSPLMSFLYSTSYPTSDFQAYLPLKSVDLGQGISAYKFRNINLLLPGQRDWRKIKFSGKYIVIAKNQQAYVDQVPSMETVYYPDLSPAFSVFTQP